MAMLTADGAVRVWVANRWRTAQGFPTGVAAIAQGADELWCVTEQGAAYCWKAGSGWRHDETIADVVSLSFSADNTLYAALADGAVHARTSGADEWSPTAIRTNSELTRAVRTAARKPGWLRFGMRSLLVVFVLLAVLLGPLRWFWQFNKRVKEQEVAVAILESQGAVIQYAHEFDPTGKPIRKPTEPGPGWLKSLLGRHAVVTPVKLRWYLGDVDSSRLAALPSLRELEVGDLSQQDVVNIAKLKNLERLKIMPMDPFYGETADDFSPLGELRELSSVDIIVDGSPNLSFLRKLDNLKTLRIDANHVFELPQLGHLPKLESVHMTQPDSLTPLRGAKQLKTLVVEPEHFAHYAEHLKSLDGVEGLPNLVELEAANSNVHDLSPLRGLKRLESLNLAGAPAADLSPLADCTGLKYLAVGDEVQPQPIDLAPICKLPELEELSVFGAAVVQPDELARMKKLRYLRIHLPSTDLSGVARVTNLRELSVFFPLSEQRSPDLSELAGLKNLESLAIGSVDNVAPTSKMMRLMRLSIHGEDNLDLTPLAQAPALEELRYNHREIDLEQLKAAVANDKDPVREAAPATGRTPR